MLSIIKNNVYRSLLVQVRNNHTQYVTRNESNGTREITLCHEKTKNSLSLDMMNCLIEEINKNKDDTTLRAIVLSAKGNVFSAGHNLKELHNSTGLEHHRLIFRKATELMTSIIQSPVPVIAKKSNNEIPFLPQFTYKVSVTSIGRQDISDVFRIVALNPCSGLGGGCEPCGFYYVNGFAAAAGCQFVATCDIIICSENSKFSTPGANFGIFCSTPGIAVGRCMPKSRAMFMLLTGEPISAQEAYDGGLVTKVVPAEKLDEETNKIIETIKLKSRSVIACGKQFFYKQIDLSLLDAYKLGEDIMVENINADDGQEGINSFAQKRKPKWSHK